MKATTRKQPQPEQLNYYPDNSEFITQMKSGSLFVFKNISSRMQFEAVSFIADGHSFKTSSEALMQESRPVYVSVFTKNGIKIPLSRCYQPKSTTFQGL